MTTLLLTKPSVSPDFAGERGSEVSPCGWAGGECPNYAGCVDCGFCPDHCVCADECHHGVGFDESCVLCEEDDAE